MRSCLFLVVSAALAVVGSAAALPRAGLANSGELLSTEVQHARGSSASSERVSNVVVPEFNGGGWKRAADSVEASKREEAGAGDAGPSHYKRGAAEAKNDFTPSLYGPGKWKRDDDGEVAADSAEFGPGHGHWRGANTESVGAGHTRWKKSEQSE